MSDIKNTKLAWFDDGKQKYQSHEVYLKEPEDFCNNEENVWSANLFDTFGYGATKEEALENLKKKLKYLFEQYRELEKMIFESDDLINNMIEVDCCGKEVVKKPKA